MVSKKPPPKRLKILRKVSFDNYQKYNKFKVIKKEIYNILHSKYNGRQKFLKPMVASSITMVSKLILLLKPDDDVASDEYYVFL